MRLVRLSHLPPWRVFFAVLGILGRGRTACLPEVALSGPESHPGLVSGPLVLGQSESLLLKLRRECTFVCLKGFHLENSSTPLAILYCLLQSFTKRLKDGDSGSKKIYLLTRCK